MDRATTSPPGRPLSLWHLALGAATGAAIVALVVGDQGTAAVDRLPAMSASAETLTTQGEALAVGGDRAASSRSRWQGPAITYAAVGGLIMIELTIRQRGFGRPDDASSLED